MVHFVRTRQDQAVMPRLVSQAWDESRRVLYRIGIICDYRWAYLRIRRLSKEKLPSDDPIGVRR
jgi:hypothetical protein